MTKRKPKKIEDWERIIKLQVCKCGTFGYCKKCLPIIELIKSLLQEKEEEIRKRVREEMFSIGHKFGAKYEVGLAQENLILEMEEAIEGIFKNPKK